MPRKAAQTLPNGTLHIEKAKDGSGFYWAGHWRYDGRHVKRRIGRAHVKPRRSPREAKGWTRWFDKAPDGGDGSTERWAVASACLIASILAAIMARRAKRARSP